MIMKGGNLRNSADTARRAAVSNSAQDLDGQARLEVEGKSLHSEEKGHDPEILLCVRWAAAMETARASHG
ncbi:hypothetical protein MicloDRAFT_00031950 [Microvirga lotononidis]|uniref:Uncharacterized protein n=1 Tax=Microvirga lotononidis TaxID=864069 RepID=I4YRQ4_9HYPH|nr:hypothetical protein MicloDRAFT_00031950 [Microvirga lotononidis]